MQTRQWGGPAAEQFIIYMFAKLSKSVFYERTAREYRASEYRASEYRASEYRVSEYRASESRVNCKQGLK